MEKNKIPLSNDTVDCFSNTKSTTFDNCSKKLNININK